MACTVVHSVLFLLSLQFLVADCMSIHPANELVFRTLSCQFHCTVVSDGSKMNNIYPLIDIFCLTTDSTSIKMLDVGKELVGEILLLKMGQRLYQLCGLKASAWYEVKISYPASIPASFSIQLRRGVSDIHFGMNRKMLNTEKLIFKSDVDKLETEAYVLVTVEAAGIVAKPHSQERDTVLFNIVCDELSFGIPHKAWCVGIVAILCLVLAIIAPYYLPSGFLSNNQIDEQRELASMKAS